MPEFPEVATVIKALKKHVINKTIINVITEQFRLFPEAKITDFQEILTNQTINNIEQRAKFIIFHLSNAILLSHLRMEGKYYFYNQPTKPLLHSHVIFQFSDKSELHYNDSRIFGKFYLRKLEDYHNVLPLSKLADEPWKLQPQELFGKLSKTSRAIKTCLLDQTIIAGLGNIYVDEVLFQLKIHPQTQAKTLTLKDCIQIINITKLTFEKAIAAGGTTIDSYQSVNGVMGHYQNQLLVHQKAKQPCLNCKKPISKIKVNQRGTYFCNHCQILKD